MRPIANRFFPRGGFSSSQWNHIEQINDTDAIDSLYENNAILYDSVNQNRSRRGHQKFRCGLSA